MNQFTLSEQTLQGHVSNYRLYESIASGGFGSVSIGDDTGTKVPVAIERLHAQLKDEPGFTSRSVRSETTSRLIMKDGVVYKELAYKPVAGGTSRALNWGSFWRLAERGDVNEVAMWQ